MRSPWVAIKGEAPIAAIPSSRPNRNNHNTFQLQLVRACSVCGAHQLRPGPLRA